MNEIDVVNYILEQNIKLKTTYYKYEELLHQIKGKNYNLFFNTINIVNDYVSDYIKTSTKTLNNSKDKMHNTFNNNYHNDFIEVNNNFIKVLKRSAFDFRSFRRFKA